MWIIISILVALGSLFGHRGAPAFTSGAHSAAANATRTSAQQAHALFMRRAESGSGPVGSPNP